MMMKMFAIIALAASVSTSVFAHGGGTDAYGCHTERKTGTYHCH
jgi:hypothetical protein